jgi:outer membrane protein insertion porin family
MCLRRSGRDCPSDPGNGGEGASVVSGDMDSKQLLLSAALAFALDRPSALADDGSSDAERAADIEEEPPKGGTFAVGAGFSTDDGFVFGSAVSQDNLFGRGQHLSLNARLSQRHQLFLIRFAEPRVGDSKVGLAIDLYNDKQAWPGFDRTAVGGAFTLSRPIAPRTQVFASYRLEQVGVEVPGAEPVMRLIEPGMLDPQLMLRGGLLSSIRTGIIHDSRDQPFFPRRGSSAGAWIEVADRSIGSETELTRGRVYASHHRPIGPFTLHLSGQVDGVTSRDPRGVPLSERLQLDGSSELRGFAPGSLGPSDGGLALGGNVKAVGRGEIEFPILPRLGLSGAVFVDAGGVLDLEGRSGSGFGQSVGVGLLWRTPLGPLRLDVAMPIDGDGKPRFVFGIGGTF